MTFKKRLIAICMMVGFVVIATVVSLVAIFANSNLLVKTNVSVYYTGISLDSAYVATNSWRMGDQEKTENLALTKAEEATTASEISTTLTRDYNYVVYEFILENRSQDYPYYFQVTYTDDSTADTNMLIKYCSSSGAPIEIEDILNGEIGEVKEYYWNGATVLCNNVVANPNSTAYAYVIVCVDDIWYDAKFSGSFTCNINMEKYVDAPQLSVRQDNEGITGYYVKMGEMPQSYAGNDDSLFTLTEEVYTECGVQYPVYLDADQNKCAKKNGNYYKFEPIIWDAVACADSAYYYPFSNGSIGNVFADSNYKRGCEYAGLQSRYVLFNSVWNETLTRVNYPDSTIFANLNAFFNEVLIRYAGCEFNSEEICYNNAKTGTQAELKDYNVQYYDVDAPLFLCNVQMIGKIKQYMSATKTVTTYSTPWANGTDSYAVADWWTRTNQYNTSSGTAIYVAGVVSGTDMTVTAGDLNLVRGVRPSIYVKV